MIVGRGKLLSSQINPCSITRVTLRLCLILYPAVIVPLEYHQLAELANLVEGQDMTADDYICLYTIRIGDNEIEICVSGRIKRKR